jgi:hypothetical protein
MTLFEGRDWRYAATLISPGQESIAVFYLQGFYLQAQKPFFLYMAFLHIGDRIAGAKYAASP